MKNQKNLTRRNFLKNTALASGLLILPSRVLGREGATSPNSKIRIACIGVGGIGWTDIHSVAKSDTEITAMCDVDNNALERAGKDFPDAKKFHDYREMFEKFADNFDAFTVSIPDHSHFGAAYQGITLGKHAFVQKPLAQTVDQCQRLWDAAKKHKIATQMGNGGQSADNIRSAREWYEVGVIGDIKEVLIWTDRPIWPQGFDDYQPEKVAPANLNWDLWLGPAAKIPYHPGIAPFNWRGYYDYGTGAPGDMAIHNMSPANYILGLGEPTKVEVDLLGEKPKKISYPAKSRVTYHFPATKTHAACKVIWCDGPGAKPTRPEGLPEIGDGGSIFYGTKETALLGDSGFIIAGTPEHFTELRKNAPPQKFKRIRGGHHQNWLDAIRGGDAASSNFDYAAPFAKVVLLGSIVQRLGRSLEWDAKNGTFKNDTDANALLKAPSARAGFLA